MRTAARATIAGAAPSADERFSSPLRRVLWNVCDVDDVGGGAAQRPAGVRATR